MYNNLVGTRTMNNVMMAFTRESEASTKYRIFAENSEYDFIEKLFEGIANEEVEHAEVFLEILGGIGSDFENLEKSSQLERFESAIDYPEMAKVAEEEGFMEIAEKFRLVAEIEANHKRRFDKYVELMKKDSLYKRDNKKTRWKCTECGLIHEGQSPPEECPFCGHDQDDFREL